MINYDYETSQILYQIFNLLTSIDDEILSTVFFEDTLLDLVHAALKLQEIVS